MLHVSANGETSGKAMLPKQYLRVCEVVAVNECSLVLQFLQIILSLGPFFDGLTNEINNHKRQKNLNKSNSSLLELEPKLFPMLHSGYHSNLQRLSMLRA